MRVMQGQEPMNTRAQSLEEFVTAMGRALLARAKLSEEKVMLTKSFEALQAPAEASMRGKHRLPPCRHLESLKEIQSVLPHDLSEVLKAFFVIESSLFWQKRSGSSEGANQNYADGHANTLIVGPGGLERRTDVWIGATILDPYVRYPDHTHPPEETYLVLSPGKFSHNNEGWVEPGVGGTFYNPPGVLHCMESGDKPLFAFWVLWNGAKSQALQGPRAA